MIGDVVAKFPRERKKNSTSQNLLLFHGIQSSSASAPLSSRPSPGRATRAALLLLLRSLPLRRRALPFPLRRRGGTPSPSSAPRGKSADRSSRLCCRRRPPPRRPTTAGPSSRLSAAPREPGRPSRRLASTSIPRSGTEPSRSSAASTSQTPRLFLQPTTRSSGKALPRQLSHWGPCLLAFREEEGWVTWTG